MNANCDLKLSDFGQSRVDFAPDVYKLTPMTEYVCTRWSRELRVFRVASDAISALLFCTCSEVVLLQAQGASDSRSLQWESAKKTPAHKESGVPSQVILIRFHCVLYPLPTVTVCWRLISTDIRLSVTLYVRVVWIVVLYSKVC